MSIRSLPPVFACLLLAGCLSDVPAAKMDAAKKWSTAMCKCADKPSAEAKACAGKLTEPEDPSMEGDKGPKYKLDSLHAYADVITIGITCQAKIGPM